MAQVTQQSEPASSASAAPQPTTTADGHDESGGTIARDDGADHEQAASGVDDSHGVAEGGGEMQADADDIDEDSDARRKVPKHKEQRIRRQQPKSLPDRPPSAVNEFPVSAVPRLMRQAVRMWVNDQETDVTILREEAAVFPEEAFGAERAYILIKSILGAPSIFVWKLADAPQVLCPYMPVHLGAAPQQQPPAPPPPPPPQSQPQPGETAGPGETKLTFTVSSFLSRRIGDRGTNKSQAEYAAMTMTTTTHNAHNATHRHFTFEVPFHFGLKHDRSVMTRDMVDKAFRELGQLLTAHCTKWFTQASVKRLEALEKPHVVLYLYAKNGRVPSDFPATTDRRALQPDEDYAVPIAKQRRIDPNCISVYVDSGLLAFISAYLGPDRTLWDDQSRRLPHDARMVDKRNRQ
ncbi:unnamed protein product [Vitrella brassicaformis CCMP3155]|uniref:Uncharacterized protein n=2 Tax=Vitrella brassicaformis TaxID=1169539 RepID=A0A0G4F1T5_VITBC|nr:unnamed protein product [Vitrella brassicaformis CCMP3155]|mmetsp:Transcript_7042/g.17125  ORF Transcript_7042/g.17125 Transcript_7042/m.17125 type:complete len:407 (+) Transcript_7042:169-1389(+)|eukprot:CEM05475.1 unnamed protein product [Vitrella brassicaformis CCMP3155]